MRSPILKTLSLLAIAIIALSSCRNEDNKIPETCFDEVRNQGELRVDCGGPNCPECLPDCTDLIQNQDEESPVTISNSNVRGIDCGGESCVPCATCDDLIQNAHWVYDPNLTEENIGQPGIGQTLTGSRLYRLVMETGIDCGFPCNACPPDCENGIQDGDEEGVDCGGSCSTPCNPPTCADGIQNGTETGIDCGDLLTEGLACGDCPEPTCSDGIQNIHIELTDIVDAGYLVVVETGIDCDDDNLTSCPDCPIPTCFDGVQNGTEEGIDCGGACGNECDPTPSCANGFQDGTETGIDCDDDDATACPPCATCGDGIKNGPEFDVDCTDYPIPQYPCNICPSCHDNIQTPELYELDIDCGGDCEDCPAFVTAAGIGNLSSGGTPFRDQYSYNALLAASGNSDTLELDHNQYPGLLVTKELGGFGVGDPYLKVEANQGFQTDNGIYLRTIIMYLPLPEDIGVGTNVDLEPIPGGEPLGFGDCGPPVGFPSDNEDLPLIYYSEKLVENTNLLNRCFFAITPPPSTNYPSLNYNYLQGFPQASEYLVKGSVDSGLMFSLDGISGDITEGVFNNIQFNFQYDYF